MIFIFAAVDLVESQLFFKDSIAIKNPLYAYALNNKDLFRLGLVEFQPF